MTDHVESRGDVVQIDPDSPIGLEWGPQFVVVTEVKPWGVQGYFVHVAGRKQFGPAYLRLERGTYEHVGTAVWWVP